MLLTIGLSIYWIVCAVIGVYLLRRDRNKSFVSAAMYSPQAIAVVVLSAGVIMPWAGLAWLIEFVDKKISPKEEKKSEYDLYGSKDDHYMQASGFVLLYVGSQIFAVVLSNTMPQDVHAKDRNPASTQACSCK